jgi:hypothetical protein
MPRADLYRSVGAALAVGEISRRLDALAVRVVRALEAADVPCLLLRGPILARWLYESASERPYDDVDLLVPVALNGKASEVLAGLGLRSMLGEAAPSERASHASTFAGRDGDVDLHWTLRGIIAGPDAVWAEFSKGRERMPLDEGPVPMARPAARAFTIALHAAQHHRGGVVQLEDLRRAIDRLPRRVWAEAAAMARELDAVPAFTSGLALVPGGEPLLRELGVEREWTLDLAVRAEGEVPMTRGLTRLSATPGLAGKLRLLGRELFPTPAFMREWSPLARRGGAGLAAAYAIRPWWLVRHIVPAVRAYRRAWRRSR